ncbi:MAG: hypothetical protein ACRES5_00020 [Pseudomonas sp.]
MIDGNSQPLAVAARVLKPETLAAVRSLADYSLRAWRILDRWALNSPDELHRLEAEGEIVLLGRLLEQQRIEQRAIDRQPVGVPEQEALAIAKVQTELDGGPSLTTILAGKTMRREALTRAVKQASPAELETVAKHIREVLQKPAGAGARQRLRLVPRTE